MKKYSLGALVAAGLLMGGLGAGSASAADLGGNCCADLEERIAELEATTARKGNRKVSLTVSGWVAEQVMWWDDGFEENVYVIGLGSTLATNVKFTGQATISPGYYAGYVMHLEAIDSDSLTIDQGARGVFGFGAQGPAVDPLTQQGDLTSSAVTVLQSFWFIKSDHLGKVSVGRQSQASDNTAILVDGSGSLVPANWVAFDVNAFQIYNSAGGGTGLTWGNAGSCRGMGGAWGDCNGLTREAVRYDSPVYGGFSVSASWGDDDFWDVAARYAGEHAGIKVAAAAAYNEWSDGNNPVGATGTVPVLLVPAVAVNISGSNSLSGTYPNPGSAQYFQAGLYLEHTATGLWILGNYGHLDDDFSILPEAETYYVKAGLRERWSHLGHTIVFGEWLQNDDGAVAVGCSAGCTSSELQGWGAGIVQEIDAAAMSMWLTYRHLEFDDSTAINYEDFQLLKFGALINF